MLYAVVAFLVLVLDQAVKYWATVNIAFNEGSARLIPGFIRLVNIHNYGAAFGFLQNLNARWLFVLVAIIFVAVVILALSKNYIRGALGRWSAVLIMAGAVGNCIDRVMNGYVVDMFQFEFKILGRDFAVFNVADIFITICGILFCVYIIFSDEFKGKDHAESTEGNPGHVKKAPIPKTKPPEPVTAGEADVRAYVPKSKRPAAKDQAAPKEPDSSIFKMPAAKAGADPFAEWESLPPLDARPDHTPDAAVISSSVASEETVSKAPPAAKPKQSGMDFTLEDILAEYSSK